MPTPRKMRAQFGRPLRNLAMERRYARRHGGGTLFLRIHMDTTQVVRALRQFTEALVPMRVAVGNTLRRLAATWSNVPQETRDRLRALAAQADQERRDALMRGLGPYQHMHRLPDYAPGAPALRHAHSVVQAAGGNVVAGQIIGRVGATSKSQGPHLRLLPNPTEEATDHGNHDTSTD